MSLAIGAPSSNLSDDIDISTAKEIEKDISDGSRHSSDEHVVAEKGELFQVTDYEQEGEDENENLILSHEEQFPIDPNAQEETAQFTFRAVFVGCCLGGVIAASKYVPLISATISTDI